VFVTCPGTPQGHQIFYDFPIGNEYTPFWMYYTLEDWDTMPMGGGRYNDLGWAADLLVSNFRGAISLVFVNVRPNTWFDIIVSGIWDPSIQGSSTATIRFRNCASPWPDQQYACPGGGGPMLPPGPGEPLGMHFEWVINFVE
jgi:hypothetical protein